MRKFFLGLAAAAAVLTAGSIATRADAAGPAPVGLNRAIADVAVVDKVHCVPGWRHHTPTNWRRANGCARYYRYGGVVTGYPTWGYRTWGSGYRSWGYRTGVDRTHRVVRSHRVHRHHRHHHR
jgi:hypothetical protein